MSLDVAAIREGIANTIASASNLYAYPWLVDTPNYPAATVLLTSIEYHETMTAAGYSVLYFDVEVAAQATEPPDAQVALARYMSTGTAESIIDALEAVASGQTTPTLSGVVNNIVVESVNVGPGTQLETGQYAFSAVFKIAVRAARS